MNIETAFVPFPTLKTSRLRLRKVLPDDSQALFLIKSNPEVTSNYGQEPHQEISETMAWIWRLQADYELQKTLSWSMTISGEEQVIGVCMFWNFDPGYHLAEIGYELHPAYWGQGLMGEALQATLSYGFDRMELHRVEANPLKKNFASHKLLTRLGFKLEGSLRQRHYFRGEFIDQLYFGLLREEWS